MTTHSPHFIGPDGLHYRPECFCDKDFSLYSSFESALAALQAHVQEETSREIKDTARLLFDMFENREPGEQTWARIARYVLDHGFKL